VRLLEGRKYKRERASPCPNEEQMLEEDSSFIIFVVVDFRRKPCRGRVKEM